ncbi:MAG: DNA translocase FtsK 4TM domain-containing protein [Hyphomicrobiales bacterium]
MSEFLPENDYEPLNHSLDDSRILPKTLQHFVLNRVLEIFGLFVLAGVLFTATSIVSWSPTDPSLNHATSDITQNRLGLAGAYTSDFLIQTFGLAVIFLFIPIIIVGFSLTRHQTIKRPILRTLSWIFAGFFLAGAMAALPTFADWPLKTGLGGIAGNLAIKTSSDLLGSSVHLLPITIAAVILAILGLALGLYACGFRFKEMLAAVTFINESSFDSGAQMVKNATQTSSMLGRKSISLANHIARLKDRNKTPFDPAKRPWKTPDDNAPLEYQNLTENNYTDEAARNETDMKNAPEFLSKINTQTKVRQGGERSAKYNPLKAKTNQFISKIMSGLSGQKPNDAQTSENHHVDPSFNPHAFEPIPRNTQTDAMAETHIPALHQEVQQHYQVQQADPYQIDMPQQAASQMPQNEFVQSEVVGNADMGDFYDGPNSYEDYWADSVRVAEPSFASQAAPLQQAAPVQHDVHPFAPQAQAQDMQYQAAPVQATPAPQAAPAYPEDMYNDMPAYDQYPTYEQPVQAVAPMPIPAAQPAPFVAPTTAPIAPVAVPIAAAPIPVAPIPVPQAAPIAPAPALDIEPAENSVANAAPQPFDLSAPQVDVRKGRVVETSGNTGFINAPTPENYELPSVDLLAMPVPADEQNSISEKILAANARILENVLAEFRISGEIMNVRPGPVVTLYELEPAPGVKSARVIGLADDIARSMSAVSARIAVIPGRNVIGIELPNEHRDTVFLNEIIRSEEFKADKLKLPMALGKSIDGTPVVADLARMPHLLIAGTTGSGKSVGINSMILSILYKMSPEKCKLIMIDPKMLELSIYDGIPHLLTPVVTDPKKAVVALKWSVREMENRYKKMSKMGVRNIEGYNQRIKAAEDKGEPLMRTVQTGFDHETGQPVYEHEALDYKEMPFIVIVIDEMADLMMVAGKEIEGVIQRLAQMARAAGIHMITATQRPSVDVITGSIKANFPTRISFQVTSKIDSRTILNEMGAEQLLGQGDMLHMAGGGRINRVHGAFVADDEVESVVNHLKRQGVPQYIDDITTDVEPEGETAAPDGGPAPTTDSDGNELDLYDQAVAIVARDKKASTSYIQRKLSIGYNRAATIIERMEEEGVVGAANHAGKREILVGDHSEA